MSKPDDGATKALSNPPRSTSYEVGYAKPPVETRFKPGRSGNPTGRPKGSKNRKPALNEERLKTIILEEAYRTIKVNDGPRQVTVPMAQAVVRSLAHNAVKGNTRAQRLFSEMVSTTEAQNSRDMQDLFESAIVYKQKWYAELERRRITGSEGPEPLPHPDHVVVNARMGTVQFKGPMTEEEKQAWDMMIATREQAVAELADLRKDLEAPAKTEHVPFLEEEIRHTENIIRIIDRNLGKVE
jgi:hypothetical protein